MPSSDVVARLLQASDWWIIRGESGKLWPTLFEPRSIVAQGRLVPRFPSTLDYASRQRAMLPLDDFARGEVEDFIAMAEGDVVVTPQEGTTSAWFGVLSSDSWFAAPDCNHWMQRTCDWYKTLIPLSAEASQVLRQGRPLGTVFDVSGSRDVLIQCIRRAVQDAGRGNDALVRRCG